MRTILSLVIALAFASYASAQQCNVRSADTASAAAAVERAQTDASIRALQDRLDAAIANPRTSSAASAASGASAASSAVNDSEIRALRAEIASLRANRASAANAASAAASVSGGCANGSCGAGRVRTLGRFAAASIPRPRANVARSSARTDRFGNSKTRTFTKSS